MSAARKDLPPPADDALADALRRRLHRDETPATSGDISRTPRTSATGATGATDPQPVSVRRSWYMPRASADALAAAIEDLHFATRRPKQEVIAALIAVALEHQEEARQRLTG